MRYSYKLVRNFKNLVTKLVFLTLIIQKGGEAMTAIEQLFSEYYKDVYRYLYSLCRDAPLSEDLASETFLEVVKSISRFRGDSDVKTWLFSIARHRWCNYLRKKKRTVEETGLYDLTEREQPAVRSAEDVFLTREISERVYTIIDRECERSKKAALMRIQGYSFREIGNALEISESSARVIFFRTKEKILKILKEEGYNNV